MMGTGRLIIPTALLVCLTASLAGEEPAPLTLKLRAAKTIPLSSEDSYVPITVAGDRVVTCGVSLTWGEAFYGGLLFSYINVWHEPFGLMGCGIKPLLSAHRSQNYVLTAYPALGGVVGFNLGGSGFLSAHVELSLSLNLAVTTYGSLDLYPRVTAGPDFNLGGGWRLSAEVDYFFMYVGLGGGLSYTF
jgi:hypothetical protein